MPDLHSTNTNSERIETLLHQLRNPLTAITTFAKLLDKRRAPDDPNGWIVERIEQECQHMRSLIDRFDAEEGLSEGTDRPPAVPDDPILFPMQVFLDELWPTYSALAAERGIEALSDNALPPAIHVEANPLGLREAIDNLMDNAMKYTPVGGTVVLAAAVEGDTIAIRVSDTGPGIAPSDLSQIFERHFRVDGEQPGQGLGLAIAQDLVTDMNGQLTVQSTVGEGTQFTIQLPVSNVANRA